MRGRNHDRATEKKLAVLLYGTGKASFRYLGKLLNVCPATAMNWVKAYTEKLAEPEVSVECQHIELDEMWHFLGSKKTRVVKLAGDI